MVQDRHVRAEAASWVTRLHGPDRSTEVEQGLRRWLAESPAHREAFELATEVWQETADLPGALPRPSPRARPVGRRVAWMGLAAAASVALAVAVFHHLGGTLSTAVGEQKTVTLPDGTRVELNTNTRVKVRYDDSSRTVVLQSGEAFFDVARQHARPFVVEAGSRRIVALGTVFVVRRDEQTVAVTLVEGRVAVAPARTAIAAAAVTGADERIMEPGQRLRVDAGGAATLDEPPLERITAWQRGQLIFEDTPLQEAVAEFNRYGPTQIRLDAQAFEAVPVGGVFRVGDALSFAEAVAGAHGLAVVRRGDTLVLVKGTGESRL